MAGGVEAPLALPAASCSRQWSARTWNLGTPVFCCAKSHPNLKKIPFVYSVKIYYTFYL